MNPRPIRLAFFDTHQFEIEYFEKESKAHLPHLEIRHYKERMNSKTAHLAQNCDAVCSFVNDKVDSKTIDVLKELNIRMIALRCAGFNHVDLEAAKKAGMIVERVPAYSPHAVAEHAVAMLMTLNRKIHKAYLRIREGSFLLDGLVGIDLHGKTVGVIGTGKIGAVFCKIMLGFGCKVIAYDLEQNAELKALGIQYQSLSDVISKSKILSLHVPLSPKTHHLLNAETLAATQKGVILINTSRGGLIDSKALIRSLKKGHIAAAALDVYEEEEHLFFQDHSGDIIQDDYFARLMTFPNVLITSHQGFLTTEALSEIARVTGENLRKHLG